MKIVLTALAGLMIGLTAQAQPVISVTQGDAAGSDAFVFNIDPNGFAFDTINIEINALAGSLAQTETTPAVTNFTPALTTADTDILGLNTVALGQSYVGAEDSENRFAGALATLGGTFQSPADFLQVTLADASSEGATYQFRFALNGDEVGQAQSGTIGVPEPGSLALLGLGGLALLRRRR